MYRWSVSCSPQVKRQTKMPQNKPKAIIYWFIPRYQRDTHGTHLKYLYRQRHSIINSRVDWRNRIFSNWNVSFVDWFTPCCPQQIHYPHRNINPSWNRWIDVPLHEMVTSSINVLVSCIVVVNLSAIKIHSKFEKDGIAIVNERYSAEYYQPLMFALYSTTSHVPPYLYVILRDLNTGKHRRFGGPESDVKEQTWNGDANSLRQPSNEWLDFCHIEYSEAKSISGWMECGLTWKSLGIGILQNSWEQIPRRFFDAVDSSCGRSNSDRNIKTKRDCTAHTSFGWCRWRHQTSAPGSTLRWLRNDAIDVRSQSSFYGLSKVDEAFLFTFPFPIGSNIFQAFLASIRSPYSPQSLVGDRFDFLCRLIVDVWLFRPFNLIRQQHPWHALAHAIELHTRIRCAVYCHVQSCPGKIAMWNWLAKTSCRTTAWSV